MQDDEEQTGVIFNANEVAASREEFERPGLLESFATATTIHELADLVWALRATVSNDALAGPCWAPEYMAATVSYSECLGLYFSNAQRILGRSLYAIELDEIDCGFGNPRCDKQKGLERGRRVLQERFPQAGPVPAATVG